MIAEDSGLTAEIVRALFSYDPETGSCKWLERPITHSKAARWNTVYAGTEVGSFDKDGYRKVCLEYRSYRLHRLIWLHYYGVWPSKHLDHENGSPADNRIKNLREATPRQNAWNRVRGRTSIAGHAGVYLTQSGKKFRARPSVDGKLVNAGTFGTLEEAAAARDSMVEYRGEFRPAAVAV